MSTLREILSSNSKNVTFDSSSKPTSTTMLTAVKSELQTPPEENIILGLAERSIRLNDNNFRIPEELNGLINSIQNDGFEPKFKDIVEIVNKLIIYASNEKERGIKQVIEIHKWENNLEEAFKWRENRRNILNKQEEEQARLETRLNGIEEQQSELAKLVDSFEELLSENNNNRHGSNSFIHNFYDQAEAVSSKLQRMKDDLFSVSENINVKSSKVGKYSNDNSDTALQRTTDMLNVFEDILEFLKDAIEKLESNRIDLTTA